MGVKNDTGFSHAVVDRGSMQRAVATVQDLGSGTAVSPEAFAHAQETLLQMLWQGAAPGAVPLSLVIVFNSCAEPDQQGEVFGEFVAAGTRAAPILDRLSSRTMKFRLSAEELSTLRDGLAMSSRDRLVIIGKMLQDAAEQQRRARAAEQDESGSEGDGQRQDERGPASSRPIVKQHAYQEPTESDHRKFRKGPPGPDPDPGDVGIGKLGVDVAQQGAASALLDANLPEEARLEAALAMRGEAIPILAGMLGGRDNEFATVALLHLAETRETRHDVYSTALRMESSEAGKSARLIRTAIDNPGGSGEDDLRARLRGAEVGDTYLTRVLNSCDAPNIMRASLGREVYAIPMAMRKLASLRASR